MNFQIIYRKNKGTLRHIKEDTPFGLDNMRRERIERKREESNQNFHADGRKFPCGRKNISLREKFIFHAGENFAPYGRKFTALFTQELNIENQFII